MKYNFKIMQPCSRFSAVEYNEKKERTGKGNMIYMGGFGGLINQDNISEKTIKEAFEDWSSERAPQLKNIQFHAVLSAKGKDNDFEEMKEMALKVMDKLGYAQNPVLIYRHNDTENDHIHIVTSRVGVDNLKIDDSFEKKRANEFLAEQLLINKNLEFNLASDNALKYNFNSEALFNLLMEKQGFQPKQKGGDYDYYKYGKLQGKIKGEDIKERISQSKTEDIVGKDKLIAVIEKYKRKYDSNVHKDFFKGKGFSFSSELTNYLKTTFGYDFVFFGNEKHDKPYGYAVIDNRNGVVYKGVDIMPLKNLQMKSEPKKTPQLIAISETVNIQSDNKLIKPAKNTRKEHTEVNDGSFLKPHESTSISTDLATIDRLLDSMLNDMEAGDRGASAGSTIKKKKKQQKSKHKR